MEEEEEGLYSQLVSGGEGSVSVGMSLVISSGFGFNCRRRRKSGPLWRLSVGRCSGYALWYAG